MPCTCTIDTYVRKPFWTTYHEVGRFYMSATGYCNVTSFPIGISNNPIEILVIYSQSTIFGPGFGWRSKIHAILRIFRMRRLVGTREAPGTVLERQQGKRTASPVSPLTYCFTFSYDVRSTHEKRRRFRYLITHLRHLFLFFFTRPFVLFTTFSN